MLLSIIIFRLINDVGSTAWIVYRRLRWEYDHENRGCIYKKVEN